MTEQAPLTTTDLTAWLALRRTNEGGVAMLDGSYYHHGRAVPHYLNASFTDLVDAGQVALTEADPDAAGMQRARLTDDGRELYATLCGKRGVHPDPRTSTWPGSVDRVRHGWAVPFCADPEESPMSSIDDNANGTQQTHYNRKPPEERGRVVRLVCSYALDADDARELCTALGLNPHDGAINAHHASRARTSVLT